LSRKRERLRRLRRFRHPGSWRSLALVATDPDIDRVFERIQKSRSKEWLDEPQPWFQPAAIDHIERLLEPTQCVVEWGSGASTLWFSRQGTEVESVEHDPRWAREIAARLSPPSRVHLTRPDCKTYVGQPTSLERADWAVIDGIHRVECAARIISMLRRGRGRRPFRVVFDDTHRMDYAEQLHDLTVLASESRHFCGANLNLASQMTSVLVFTGSKSDKGTR
jgi:hypothetical protein